MLIRGVWHPCDDGILRPVILAEILANDSSWIKVPLLLDTGADRTVLSADILEALHLPPVQIGAYIGGVGGTVSSEIVESQIRLTHEENGKVLLRGQYVGVRDKDALDMSVLGRDITNLFTAIVDWPQRSIYLLGQLHSYTITRQ